MNELSYMQLGGTLFIPASHKRLESVVCEGKYPELRSVVIDFEDALDESDFDSAMFKIDLILKRITKSRLFIFIRAKNCEHLKELLTLQNITNINGFVLAKFSLLNAETYLDLLEDTKYLIMPSIEGNELFNHQKLHELKEIIITNRDKVLLVRFGLEDMLRLLRMRRGCDMSIFDISATATVIGNFIATFKSAGFGVSGGVYPCHTDKEGFIKDAKRDMKEGLFTKTIIHPSQIAIINELYKVDKDEYEEAVEILNSKKKVFSINGKMAESLTMSSHSQELTVRAEIYGVNNEKNI
ncbi:MAG TPA: hypothetical protein EYG70_03885 [Sulfurimonas sp.]|nr:hypothetical protein [Sulfurimonas sp.]